MSSEIKPVKAWAAVDPDGGIATSVLFSSKDDSCCWLSATPIPDSWRVIPVMIVPMEENGGSDGASTS